MTKVVMGCLVASVSVAATQSVIGFHQAQTAQQSDSEAAAGCYDDSLAVEVIEMSLELFNCILSSIRQSTRAGGHMLQNFATMGTWVLATGLLAQLHNTSRQSEAGEASVPSVGGGRINVTKAVRGFGVLSVALSSQALTLVALLLDDLSSEVKEVSYSYSIIETHRIDMIISNSNNHIFC